jgi:hypothetical protein
MTDKILTFRELAKHPSLKSEDRPFHLWPEGLGIGIGSVVVIVWSGKGTRLCVPESTVLRVDVALVPFILEQADSDTRAAAARHAIMSFFISKFFLHCFFTIQIYAIGW